MKYSNPAGWFYYIWHLISSNLLVYWTNGVGSTVNSPKSASPLPEKTLILYEYNGCPFCQRVRAVISQLDLDVEVRPTPRVTVKVYGQNSDSRFRPEVQEKGGQSMYPFFIDPNTNTQMYDSGKIIDYLNENYGGKQALSPFSDLSISQIMKRSLRVSLFFGVIRVPSKLPEKPMVLYAAQGDASSILVFDALSCLELPYWWRSCAKNSRK